MWGQVGLDIWYQFDSRIIPTRVGTRRVRPRLRTRAKDHPHACGDKKSSKKIYVMPKGSSPRVWGQERQRIPTHAQTRIIPTRVGTRYLVNKGSEVGWGSSPRVWGQELLKVGFCHDGGIIPTRVGTSAMPMTPTTTVTDHPHACGDKVWPLLSLYHTRGSSPRVWGQEAPQRQHFGR